MKKITFLITVFLLTGWVALWSGCKKEEGAVVESFDFNLKLDSLDLNKVIITFISTGIQQWEWDYGDGTKLSNTGSHTHSYRQSGLYSVTCTVTKADGSTPFLKRSIDVPPLVEELISGGPAAVNGKTWILKRSASPGKEGFGTVDNSLTIVPAYADFPDDFLFPIGLGKEYEDEFVFYSDGRFWAKLNNSRALSGILYAAESDPEGYKPSAEPVRYPLASMAYETPGGFGKWSLDYSDLTLNAINDLSGNQKPEAVTFTFRKGDPIKVARFVLSPGQYLGVLDLASKQPSLWIIKEVTANKMHIAVGLNNNPLYPGLPSILIHLTLIPKPGL